MAVLRLHTLQKLAINSNFQLFSSSQFKLKLIFLRTLNLQARRSVVAGIQVDAAAADDAALRFVSIVVSRFCKTQCTHNIEIFVHIFKHTLAIDT